MIPNLSPSFILVQPHCPLSRYRRFVLGLRGKWGSEGFEESPEFYNVCVKKGDTFLCPLLCVFLEEGGRGVSQ